MIKQAVFLITITFTAVLAVSTWVSVTEQSEPKKAVREEMPVAFTQVTVIPMTGEDSVMYDQTVLVKGDRITLVADRDMVELGDGVTIIDGKGKFLIPGLTEMHGHIPPSVRTDGMPAYMTRSYVENTLFLYLANGVTTVRGMLGYEGQLSLRNDILNGSITGPTLYLAGPSFNGNTVNSVDQAASRVLEQMEEGWDLLKIHPGLTKEEFMAVAATANQAGIPFGGHVPAEAGIETALASGQISIDHVDGYVDHIRSFPETVQDSVITDVIRQTRESGTWIVPTMALWKTIIGAGDPEKLTDYEELQYIPQAVRQNYLNFLDGVEGSGYFDPDAAEHAALRTELLRRMHQAGVNIVMGTDAPQLFSVPGFSIHREIPEMIAAGMSNTEILRSATSEAGRYFKDKDRFGTINMGARADLLLLDGDPQKDLNVLRDPAIVMVRGKVLDRDQIRERLKMIRESYQ